MPTTNSTTITKTIGRRKKSNDQEKKDKLGSKINKSSKRAKNSKQEMVKKYKVTTNI